MKSRNLFQPLSGLILMLAVILSACSSSRKAAVSCPEISRYRISRTDPDHNFRKYNQQVVHRNVYSGKHIASITGNKQQKNRPVSGQNYDVTAVTGRIDQVPSINKSDYLKGMVASSDNSMRLSLRDYSYNQTLGVNTAGQISVNTIGREAAECDTIRMKSGSRLIGKVEEIGQYEIKYRRCENLNGPLIAISKADVSGIYYSNGSHDIFLSDNPVPVANNVRVNENYTPARNEGFGIAGFVASLAGLFIAGIPFGLIGVIFGAISLSKIKKNPSKLKGRGLAIASIIIGLIDIIATIVLYSML